MCTNSWASNTCFVIMTSLGKLNDKIIKMILGNVCENTYEDHPDCI